MKSLIIILLFTANFCYAQKLKVLKIGIDSTDMYLGKFEQIHNTTYIDISTFKNKDSQLVEYTIIENSSSIHAKDTIFQATSYKTLAFLDLKKKEAWKELAPNFDKATTNKIIAIYQSTLKKKGKK